MVVVALVPVEVDVLVDDVVTVVDVPVVDVAVALVTVALNDALVALW